MGCDIHCYAERKTAAGTFERIGDFYPFENRNYRVFGFLAGVRNYSDVTPISEPRGFPDDASKEVVHEFVGWDTDAHTPSWLTVAELEAFNYNAECEDRRVTRQIAPNFYNGGCTAAPGEGEKTTFREFLGEEFFKTLDRLKNIGADRVVFWFDN